MSQTPSYFHSSMDQYNNLSPRIGMDGGFYNGNSPISSNNNSESRSTYFDNVSHYRSDNYNTNVSGLSGLERARIR